MTEHMTAPQAQAITAVLLDTHGLSLWTVSFNNAKRTAGRCNHRMKEITLSKYLMAQRSYEDTMNTITHEIAHAIVGPRHGHDYTWARKHRELGGDGKRCFQHTDEKAPWIGTTDRCDCTYQRYRAPKRMTGHVCRPHRAPVTWKRNAA